MCPTIGSGRWRVLPPLSLTAGRVALAAVVVAVAHTTRSGPAFVACLVLAALSDNFDGVLARRLGVSSPALRRFDSAADVAFYLAALWAVWVARPEVVADYAWGVGLLLALEAAC